MAGGPVMRCLPTVYYIAYGKIENLAISTCVCASVSFSLNSIAVHVGDIHAYAGAVEPNQAALFSYLAQNLGGR